MSNTLMDKYKDATISPSGIIILGFSRRVNRNSMYNCVCPICGEKIELRKDHMNTQKACRICLSKAKMIDMTGRRYGRLTVIKLDHRIERKAYWECLCDCGNVLVVRNCALTSGNTKSCGCLNNELRLERNFTHRMSDTITYESWQCARVRATNPNRNTSHRYFNRGIRMCDRWINSFENFYEDMGDRPSLKYSLDRINNDGNYEPGNCRWATMTQQANNASRTVRYTVGGKIFTRHDLCLMYGINPSTFRSRIDKGWSVDKVISTPTRVISKKGEACTRVE